MHGLFPPWNQKTSGVATEKEVAGLRGRKESALFFASSRRHFVLIISFIHPLERTTEIPQSHAVRSFECNVVMQAVVYFLGFEEEVRKGGRERRKKSRCSSLRTPNSFQRVSASVKAFFRSFSPSSEAVSPLQTYEAGWSVN